MLLLDANVLIYAFRKDAEEHPAMSSWLGSALSGREPVLLCELAELAFLRITTQALPGTAPAPLETALSFLDVVRQHPLCQSVTRGRKHGAIFRKLCADYRLTGRVLTDAWLATLAIEQGATLVSADADFCRFKELRCVNPLEG